MKIIPEKILECIEIFQGIIEADEWSEKEFFSEKQVVLNQICEKGDYVYIEDVVRETVFADTALANRICGIVDNILHFQKEEIKIYKKRVFNKNNMLFCIAGCVNEMQMNMIKKQLGNIELEDGTENEWLEIPKAFHHRGPEIILENTCEKDLYSILNCILGEGVGSHLQKHIREKSGDSSNIYSYIETYKNFSVLHVRFSVEKKKFESCLGEVIHVIKSLKSIICSRDLDVSLPFYTTNNIFLQDDSSEMNFQMAYNYFILNNQCQNYCWENNEDMVTRLKEIADTVFRAENMCVVGNMNKIILKKIKEIIRDI